MNRPGNELTPRSWKNFKGFHVEWAAAEFNAAVIPSVACTGPEVAWLCLTEYQAKAQGFNVKKGLFGWTASGRAIARFRPTQIPGARVCRSSMSASLRYFKQVNWYRVASASHRDCVA